jgi:hypothetical protein
MVEAVRVHVGPTHVDFGWILSDLVWGGKTQCYLFI